MENIATQELIEMLRKEADRLEKQAQAQISFCESTQWVEKTSIVTMRMPNDMARYLDAMRVSVCLDRSKIMMQFIQQGLDNFRNQSSQETLDMINTELNKLTHS